MNIIASNLLTKTELLFQAARGSLIEAAASLYEVYKTNAWKEKYETWQDFLQEISVSQGQASKLINSFEHYAINGGVSHAKLAEVDIEKLYLAKSLEGSPEEQVEKALVLSRSEIRSQKAFEDTGEEHACEAICRICHRKLG